MQLTSTVDYKSLNLSEIRNLFAQSQSIEELEDLKNNILASEKIRTNGRFKIKFSKVDSLRNIWQEIIEFEFRKRKEELRLKKEKHELPQEFSLISLKQILDSSWDDIFAFFNTSFTDQENDDWLIIILSVTYLRVSRLYGSNMQDEGSIYYMQELEDLYWKKHGPKKVRGKENE